ncbi:hypothetical protein Slin15195_G017520 [Septoria linicola]|uniref:Uncharacterized protein n=1 Tax=Septoria linicola TaxID=215465 RepID=A0A9Q9ALR0_9PEZI|nr:hypothetical protein Slin14017_G017580 [Septoria linicola]USW48433.1 hypothetical protein Slin15195_G017520 [Septoria linicola]
MCGPLIVTCGCTPSAHKHNRPTHTLAIPKLVVPCKEPGGEACKAGEGELVEFQNPSTECAGSIAGHHPNSKEAEEICAETLKKYGDSVYRMNKKEFAKYPSKGWFRGWF